MGAQIKEALSLDYILSPGKIGEFSIYYNGTLVAKKGEPASNGGFPSPESVIERIKNLLESNL